MSLVQSGRFSACCFAPPSFDRPPKSRCFQISLSFWLRSSAFHLFRRSHFQTIEQLNTLSSTYLWHHKHKGRNKQQSRDGQKRGRSHKQTTSSESRRGDAKENERTGVIAQDEPQTEKKSSEAKPEEVMPSDEKGCIEETNTATSSRQVESGSESEYEFETDRRFGGLEEDWTQRIRTFKATRSLCQVVEASITKRQAFPQTREYQALILWRSFLCFIHLFIL